MRDEPLRTSAWEATSHHSPAHRYGRSEAHSDGRWFHLKAICEPITTMTLLIICQIYVTLGSVTNKSKDFSFPKGWHLFCCLFNFPAVSYPFAVHEPTS